MTTTLIADTLFDGKTYQQSQPINFDDGIIIALDTFPGAQESHINTIQQAADAVNKALEKYTRGFGGILKDRILPYLPQQNQLPATY